MLAIGKNPVTEALKANAKISKIAYLNGHEADLADILNLARSKDVDLRGTNKGDLDQLSNGAPHQGIIAWTEVKVKDIGKENLDGMYIYIRAAQDLHNVGAIIRTAEVAGLSGVILAPDIQLHPTIARVSMGAIFHIPIFQASLFPTIKYFKKQDFRILGIERSQEDSLYGEALPAHGMMIIGGEAEPLSKEVLAHCDRILSIPQFGQINSLNMSVAAGVAMFEWVRQHRIV